MEEIMQWDSYAEYERAFDQAYRNTVDNYILMGYMLRKAQDTDILYSSGYRTVADFAWNRYKIKPDTVSRMMSVNKRFSEGGYSAGLDGKYEGYAATVLAEMLQLPDAVIEVLPNSTTREEVRLLKAEYKEEKKTTPLELAMEKKKEGGYPAEDIFAEFVKEYYRSNPEEYIDIQPKIIKATQSTLEKTAEELLCPAGQATMTARIPGKGRYILSVKGRGQDVKLVNMRTEETEECTFQHLARTIAGACMDARYGSTPEQAWEQLTGETYEAKQKKTGNAMEKAGDQREQAEDGTKKKEEAVRKEEKTAGVSVNTEREQEDASDRDGNDADDGNREKAQEAGAGSMEPDTEEPKIAPAQPEPGNKGEEAPIEVIESPYRKHLEEVEACKSRMAKALEEGDYDTAYSAAVNIASAINEMRNIKKQKQIVGQMELEDYSGS